LPVLRSVGSHLDFRSVGSFEKPSRMNLIGLP
jgi:hypothetical protein